MNMNKATRQESKPLEISKLVSHNLKERLATARKWDEQLTQISITVAQSQVAVAVNQTDVLRSRCWDKAAEVGTLTPLGCLPNA